MSRERDYLDSFLTYIDAERKLSVHTESAYSRDLEDFILYLEGHEISIDDFSTMFSHQFPFLRAVSICLPCSVPAR